ncbi:MAG: Xaa-Pro peptidase family protein [Puniceicoccales bacterium]|jgi:Xaa-Pro aminopeptidase|nr:Xaa-Pro peptidase family protein [Puniceicoccales bacterium]
MGHAAKVLFSDTCHDANMLYWSGISVTDPFLAIEYQNRRIAIISTLERDRLRQHSHFDDIFTWEDYLSPKETSLPIFQKIGRVLSLFQKKENIALWHIPSHFPSAALVALQQQNLLFEIQENPFLPERVIKKEREIAELRQAAKITSEAMESTRQILAQCQIASNNTLLFEGLPVTSEFLRSHIELFCFQKGALAENTIASCGPQSAFPHEEGSWIIRAQSFIVIDIFPRLKSSGYFGDMTRTYIKGTPSPQQEKIYSSVLEAHRQSVLRVCAGASAEEIHDHNVAFFEEQGFPTRITRDSCTGFIHSTGHGVGLDIHEEPRLFHGAGRLSKDMVITIEPGLYYPDGGVRIEDTLLVHEKDGEKLTQGTYDWIL